MDKEEICKSGLEIGMEMDICSSCYGSKTKSYKFKVPGLCALKLVKLESELGPDNVKVKE